MKHKICRVNKIPPNQLGLMFGETHLEDNNRELWEYNIQSNAIICYFSPLCVPQNVLSFLSTDSPPKTQQSSRQQHETTNNNNHPDSKGTSETTSSMTSDDDDSSSTASSITTTPSIGRTVVVEWDDDLDLENDWEFDLRKELNEMKFEKRRKRSGELSCSSSTSSLTASIKHIRKQKSQTEQVLDKELDDIKSLTEFDSIGAVKYFNIWDCRDEEEDITECEEKNDMLSSGVWF